MKKPRISYEMFTFVRIWIKDEIVIPFRETEISVFPKIKTKDGASDNLVKERMRDQKRSNKFTFYILQKAPSISIKEIESMFLFLLQTLRKIDWKKN